MKLWEKASVQFVEATDALGGRGNACVPCPLPPQVEFGSRTIRLALSRADQELARLDGVARQVEHPELLFANYLRREAVRSSAIEGTRTTLADLVLFEASQRSLGEDDAQVESYVAAFHYGRERVSEISVGKRLFCELHALLMRNADERRMTPGIVRDCQVFIGTPTFQEARFVPPPPMFVAELLENLSVYLQDEQEVDLIKIALAHYQFEAIHPFRDGNGRIGRLMISLWLHYRQILTSPMLYLSAYFERNKNEYYDRLLSVSRESAWEEWVLFFLRGVEEQARDAWRRTQRLMELRASYKSRLQGPRMPAGLYHLVDALFNIPVLSVPGAQKILGVTPPAARSSLQKLVDVGILGPEPVQRGKTGYYLAAELLSAIDAPLEDGER